ncbi:hypothetical protein XM53_20690 [Roseovarius atlanticus]|uniref:HTH marR-type domain-containing protein n=1 Tax=Roseovarius atlanticus TaxID=1641875 RepID=A0A0T5NP25_9RHOB|nr:MarR family transcriptional regulator [Roseovarius atlanticus]KRS10588.1 hypothetical protein XM53_20690 [Roseovarius atlanticus]
MIDKQDVLIGATIHEVAQLIRVRIDDEVKESGLTRLSWLAASYIAENPGLSLSQLAEKLEIGNAPAGKLVDRMEAADLIERRASDTDRRSQSVFLTGKGTAALEELRPKNAQLRELILADLTPDERETLEDLMLRVKSRLKRSNSKSRRPSRSPQN